KWLFSLLGGLQLINSLILLRLPSTSFPNAKAPPITTSTNLFSGWYLSLKLLKKHPDFVQYLLLFFWGGAGLVMIQPTLSIFFKEELHLSYTAITLAVSACKGIALISTARIWAHWVNKMSLFRLNFYINLLSMFFVAFILLSNMDTGFLYVAYL